MGYSQQELDIFCVKQLVNSVEIPSLQDEQTAARTPGSVLNQTAFLKAQKMDICFGNGMELEYIYNYHYLVGGLEHFLFFHILGIIIPTDFQFFQRGSKPPTSYKL